MAYSPFRHLLSLYTCLPCRIPFFLTSNLSQELYHGGKKNHGRCTQCNTSNKRCDLSAKLTREVCHSSLTPILQFHRSASVLSENRIQTQSQAGRPHSSPQYIHTPVPSHHNTAFRRQTRKRCTQERTQPSVWVSLQPPEPFHYFSSLATSC